MLLSSVGALALSEPAPGLRHTTTSLSNNLLAGAAATAGGAVYIGSGGIAGHDLNFAEVYNPSLGHPVPLQPMPTGGRSAAVTVGPLVVFAGSESGLHGDTVDVFDTRSGAWASRAAGASLIDPAAASVGGKAVFVETGGRTTTAEVFDPTTGKWSAEALPIVDQTDNTESASVGSLAFFNLLDRNAVYDAAADRWSLLPARVIGEPFAAVGARVLFREGDGLGIYDTITGRWSTVAAPADLQGAGGGFSFPTGVAATLGTKLILRGLPSNDPNDTTPRLAVYDLTTGQWSAEPDTTFRDFAARATVGTQAVFAGGGGAYSFGSTDVDVFTDQTPAATFVGSIVARRGTATVTVTNTGDADYSGPYVVQVYATPPHRLKGAVLLGSVTLDRHLAPGASVRVAVPLSVPGGVAAGTYHYVAAVAPASDPSHPTPVAGGSTTFRLGGRSASGAAARPTVSAANTAFSFSRVPLASNGERRRHGLFD